VQKTIGAVNATCFDINAACSGFLFALNTANAYLVSGMYRKILVIGAETLSKVVNWDDRSTCVLFGDGAGAVVVEADEKKYVAVSGSDGVKGDVLSAGKIALQNFLTDTEEELLREEDYYMTMNGQEVFKFAVKTVPESIHQVTEKAGVAVESIDCFLLHQANVRIISSVAKRLGVDMEKMPVNLNSYGNTSAASIPILLDEVLRSGTIRAGSRVILSGFGGGLTWGTVYMEL
jgi:3-oxoacyl-[acyl-carrier-protein] synthase-3